jgi:hypothetical protein
VKTPITDPELIAELNAVLLTGLETYLKENKMFRKSKKKAFTADDFKRQLNDAIDEAGRAHIGQPAIIQIMANAIDAMRYSSIVGSPSSYHYSSTISAPPSPSAREKLADFIRGGK